MHELVLYQILLIVLAILGVLFAFNLFRNSKLSLHTFTIGLIILLILCICAIVPYSTDFLAHYLGLSRGADLLLIMGLIGLYYLIFRLYLKIESIANNLEDLLTQADKDIDLINEE
ncbi:MAG: DUF2304 family protein [Methanobrevibacter sp.]|jgi:hypothetical protein|nr:DUF2304 family protein [Methanobrevibacter sp.]